MELLGPRSGPLAWQFPCGELGKFRVTRAKREHLRLYTWLLELKMQKMQKQMPRPLRHF